MTDTTQPGSPSTLTDPAEIALIGGEVMPAAVAKVFPRLDRHARHFIELSPFLCMGTGNAAGGMDVSPRGDGPGFVRILDDRRLLIPERPGNRRHDSMINLTAGGGIGLLFFVPGINETLRVNGRGIVIKDSELLAACTWKGHTPVLGIMVEIEEVFFHCAKALLRSRLWQPEAQDGRDAFPRMGEVIRDQMALKEDPANIEAAVQEGYKRELY
ncbi:MAG: pyridoxamine 5'-phosphate oxidase family protein [Pararhodobacter sp.]|nr:pyridoxamine 5'-phosphate oxidase family protein [Pararhodobacter sp.]